MKLDQKYVALFVFALVAAAVWWYKGRKLLETFKFKSYRRKLSKRISRTTKSARCAILKRNLKRNKDRLSTAEKRVKDTKSKWAKKRHERTVSSAQRYVSSIQKQMNQQKCK